MATIIKLKRGRATTWTSLNPVLAVGEVGLVVDNSGKVIDRKTGDGVNTWANLSRDPVYWNQIQDPRPDSEISISESQVTNLVTHLGQKAPLNSPALTGTPTAPTADTATNNTQVATTAFVKAARVKPDWNATTGADAEVLNKPNIDLKANLDSPALTGTPTSPTAPTGTNTTQVATTAFVQAARIKSDWNATVGSVGEILNKPGSATPSVAGLMSAADKTKLDSLGVGLLAVDWNAPTGSYNAIANKPDLSLKAPLLSPSFTGTPTGPTAPTGTNNTQLATTAYVRAVVDSYFLGYAQSVIDGGNA